MTLVIDVQAYLKKKRCRKERRMAVVERRLHDRRDCGFHIWYAKTMSSSRGAKLILPYERSTGSVSTSPFTRNLEI